MFAQQNAAGVEEAGPGLRLHQWVAAVVMTARAAGHPTRAHEQGMFNPSAADCVRASVIGRAGACAGGLGVRIP